MRIAKGSVIIYKLFPLTSTSIQIQMVLGEFSAIEKRLPFLLAVVHPCTTPGSDAGHISIAWLWIWMFHHVITMWMLNSGPWGDVPLFSGTETSCCCWTLTSFPYFTLSPSAESSLYRLTKRRETHCKDCSGESWVISWWKVWNET